MINLERVFGTRHPVIGMLHLPALPGSPGDTLDLDRIRERVIRDAEALSAGGVHGLILENFGDVPFYPGRVPPHTVAFLAVLGRDVKVRFPLPLGVNVLRNDGRSAMAVAAATGAEFIRVNVFTGARLTDQGIVEGEAHRLLRYRKLLACGVHVFADVAVKHSAPLAPRNLEDEVEDTVFRAGASAIIVSGSGTGKAASLDEVRVAKAAAGPAPVFVGSGVTQSNVSEILACADGLIVGSAFKEAGDARNPVDPSRVRAFMAVATASSAG